MKKSFFLLFLCINFSWNFCFVVAQNNSDNKANQSLRYHNFEQESKKYAPSQFAEIFAKFLQTSDGDNFELYESSTDEYGFTHDKYEQYFKGIKVEHTVFYIHAKNGVVK